MNILIVEVSKGNVSLVHLKQNDGFATNTLKIKKNLNQTITIRKPS